MGHGGGASLPPVPRCRLGVPRWPAPGAVDRGAAAADSGSCWYMRCVPRGRRGRRGRSTLRVLLVHALRTARPQRTARPTEPGAEADRGWRIASSQSAEPARRAALPSDGRGPARRRDSLQGSHGTCAAYRTAAETARPIEPGAERTGGGASLAASPRSRLGAELRRHGSVDSVAAATPSSPLRVGCLAVSLPGFPPHRPNWRRATCSVDRSAKAAADDQASESKLEWMPV